MCPTVPLSWTSDIRLLSTLCFEEIITDSYFILACNCALKLVKSMNRPPTRAINLASLLPPASFSSSYYFYKPDFPLDNRNRSKKRILAAFVKSITLFCLKPRNYAQNLCSTCCNSKRLIPYHDLPSHKSSIRHPLKQYLAS